MLTFRLLYIVEKRASNNATAASNDKFLLGKDNRGRIGGVYGAAVYDEMEFWEGPRDYLIAFGYIQRGRAFGYHFNFRREGISYEPYTL